MATPADHRLLELLDKWRRSLELHASYSSLDDDSYWRVQPWAEHQRPSRWIIDLALQKTQALRAHVEERMAAGDGSFSDALELMIFLANLVGSEHIERFIPVAEAQDAGGARASSADPAAAADPNAVSGTREMPTLPPPDRPPPASGSSQVARTERKPAPGKTAARPAGELPRLGGQEQVIEDAVRLAQWGRKWFEMPELIARMAGRPSLPEVRRILKENKSAIDEKAKGG